MKRLPLALAAGAILAACSEEPPARTIDYYMANELALESTLVRCNADRMRTRDDPDCINARKAVDRMAKMEEEAVRERRKAQARKERAKKLREERLRAEQHWRDGELRARIEVFERWVPSDQRPPAPDPEPDEADEA